MTIMPWHRNVQRKGTLTYSAGASLKSGQWATLLDRGVAEFNR
jgi:alkylated DNA nucleotide flippase Atl1